MSVVKLFRNTNPTFESFELLETWEHKFDTFTEWTILVKVTTSSSVDFYYFHALEYVSDKSFSFWGQSQVSEPLKNKEGNYMLPNRQENVP
jgi:hypothetical protein